MEAHLAALRKRNCKPQRIEAGGMPLSCAPPGSRGERVQLRARSVGSSTTWDHRRWEARRRTARARRQERAARRARAPTDGRQRPGSRRRLEHASVTYRSEFAPFGIKSDPLRQPFELGRGSVNDRLGSFDLDGDDRA